MNPNILQTLTQCKTNEKLYTRTQKKIDDDNNCRLVIQGRRNPNEKDRFQMNPVIRQLEPLNVSRGRAKASLFSAILISISFSSGVPC